MRFTRARIVPLVVVGLAGAGVVALQSPASATVSTTTITSPLDGAHYLVTDANSDPIQTVTLTGTSDGTTGDVLNINCFGVAGSREKSDGPQGVPVQADGTFSVEMPIDTGFGSCRLRAVPDTFSSGDSLAGFDGPTITTEYLVSSKIASGPNAGMTYDYHVLFQGSKALNDFYSATRLGLFQSRLSYAGGTSSDDLWSSVASLPHRYGAVQSQVRIDGKDAYGPYTAQEALKFVDRDGAPALGYDAQRDAGTGVVTIHETDPFVVCPGQTSFPPQSADCPSFDSAGVQLERTFTTGDGDRQVHVDDVWRSTDGKPHSISAAYLENVYGYSNVVGDTTQVGLKLRWSGDFQTFPGYSTYPGPSQLANSILVRHSNPAPDGDLYAPRGAVTFDFPADVEWEQNGVVNLRAASFSVPAGGSRLLRQSFVIGTTDSEVLAKAKANQSLITPYRPDAWIKPPGGTFKGDDIYNGTGVGQEVVGGRSFVFAFQNDGTRTDSFRIKGASSMNGFGVTYLSGATGSYRITSAVTRGTYVKHNVAPGERFYVRLVVSLPSKANGQHASFPVSVTSLGNPYRRDVVLAGVLMPIP
jgi:hypothetical protein